MRNALLAIALLLAAAATASAADICYSFHLIATSTGVQLADVNDAGWLRGYTSGPEHSLSGIGEHAIGGVPAHATLARFPPLAGYDISVQSTSYGVATVSCLRDACTIRVDEAATHELARGESIDIPSEATLAITIPAPTAPR